jgi:hypothetical protein
MVKTRNALLAVGFVFWFGAQACGGSLPERRATTGASDGGRNPVQKHVKPSEPRFILLTKEGKPFPPFGGGPTNRVLLRGSPKESKDGAWVTEGAGYRVAFLLGNYPGTFGGSGVEQVLEGAVTNWYGYDVDSDPSYPLAFKWVKEIGCVRLSGKGTLKGPDGVVHPLGANDSVDYWLERAKDPDVLVRQGAAQALGYLARTKEDKDRALPALTTSLGDSAMEVRRDAAEALGRLGDPRASEALVPLLDDEAEEWWPAEVAAEALSKIRTGLTARSVSKLVGSLNGKKEKGAAVAALSLAAAGTDAVAPLVNALGHASSLVRRNAANALGIIGDPGSKVALQSLVKVEQDDDVKKAAMVALGRIR